MSSAADTVNVAVTLLVSFHTTVLFSGQISARDYDGKDITDKLKIYGDVDVFHRGVYNIKCIVRGESGIKSIRNMNVVVE